MYSGRLKCKLSSSLWRDVTDVTIATKRMRKM
jgi:hypothetical protein